MGETCGLKMIYDTYPVDSKCPLCLQIEKKQRRYEKARADYARWSGDAARKASASKAYDEINALYQEIVRLQKDRESRIRQVGNNRRSDARSNGSHGTNGTHAPH